MADVIVFGSMMFAAVFVLVGCCRPDVRAVAGAAKASSFRTRRGDMIVTLACAGSKKVIA